MTTPTPDWTSARAGLYLHVPFCSAICPYCDFAVLVAGAAKRSAFVTLIASELEGLKRDGALDGAFAGPFDTIYLGGGTPSLLSTDALEALLDRVRGAVHVAHDARLFLEANPEDVDDARLAAWRALGVSNLSLGLQAFDDESLAFLGRRHSGAQATEAARRSIDAGFETVSLDLIYGLPGQDRGAWIETLDHAVALRPEHLSCYQLTIEAGTPFGQQFARGTLTPLADDTQGDLFVATHEHLTAAGYEGYEVSNFARHPHDRSAHNQKYWHDVPYLGLGPSAHSFDGQARWWNERHLTRYGRLLRGGHSVIAECERPTASQRALEALMLGLRTVEGLDVAAFRSRHGVDLVEGNEDRIARLLRDGLVAPGRERVQLTLAGRAVVEAIVADWSLDTVSR